MTGSQLDSYFRKARITITAGRSSCSVMTESQTVTSGKHESSWRQVGHFVSALESVTAGRHKSLLRQVGHFVSAPE